MRRFLAAGLVAGALSPFAGAANQSFSPIVVTRDSLALKCSPREVAAVVLRFETALDAGDRKALERVFAPDGSTVPTFQWFTTPDVTIRDRSRLVPYLFKLHARGEGIRLLAVDVGNSWVPHSVGVGVSLLEVGGSSRQLYGKAEVDCLRRRIWVWAVGTIGISSRCPGVPTANALRVVLACSRTGRKPLAQEMSRDFAVVHTRLRLPRRCAPAAVETRVVGALRAFNLAGASAFARSFTPEANMQPYTATVPLINLRGRAQIAAYAARRAARGDGWTAARLLPPTGSVGLPADAVYGLTLRVNSPRGSGENGVKLVVDCRSGLLTHWVGPALAEPR